MLTYRGKTTLFVASLFRYKNKLAFYQSEMMSRSYSSTSIARNEYRLANYRVTMDTSRKQMDA